MIPKNKISESHHYEDLAIKAAMQVFGNDLLPYLGIEGEITEILSTESIDLSMIQTFSDFNFRNEYNVLIHLEFQSSNQGAQGLKDNRMREVLLAKQYDAEVITYVIYSGNVKNPGTELVEGINTYRVNAIVLSDRNADQVFAKIQSKIHTPKALDHQEIIELLLTPLMGGTMPQYQRIAISFRILEQCEASFAGKYEVKRFQAVLFALASKFLTSEEMEQLKKEVINMSYLGDWLIEEGMKRREKQIICNMLKLQTPYEQISHIMEVSIDHIKTIAQEFSQDPTNT